MAYSDQRSDRELLKFRDSGTTDTSGREEAVIAVVTDPGNPIETNPSTAGTTKHFNGTATTSPDNVPAVAGGNIRTVFMTVPKQSGLAGVLISFDGGVEYTEIQERGSIIWPILGSVTQVKVKTSSGSFKYQIILNRDIP